MSRPSMENLSLLLFAALLLLAGVALAWVFQPAIVAHRRRGVAPSPGEGFFTNPATGGREPFPSIERDAPEVTLTVVVPAYNEEERLHLMLDPALAFLEKRRQQVPGKRRRGGG